MAVVSARRVGRCVKARLGTLASVTDPANFAGGTASCLVGRLRTVKCTPRLSGGKGIDMRVNKRKTPLMLTTRISALKTVIHSVGSGKHLHPAAVNNRR